MSRHKCTKEIYKAFLQASSVRYSGLALSEVSPKPFSHDSVSRWLQSQQYRPRDIWHIVKDLINTEEPCLLVVDDTVLDKHRSKQIDLVHQQYSGNAHDVIAGIGLVNLVWYGLERNILYQLIIVYIRTYALTTKSSYGPTKNWYFQYIFFITCMNFCHKLILVSVATSVVFCTSNDAKSPSKTRRL
ncbi:hypothetical protein Psal073_02062 [Piscirickettsia salmonis]|uniref:hypothetical protein n=1 Tax=Piscirickettsia salmonis TaxID=1238 RepID=UPI0012BAB8FB|nr:hypothetical protein [Piscirickettsia salmonis]QGO67095.1 hypothetical protein Psal073_02062 [Piscirickettsia salmonis]